MIRLETRTNPYTRFRVYFGLLQETVSQNFKERKSYKYIQKRSLNTMKGYNMTVKMKIKKKRF